MILVLLQFFFGLAGLSLGAEWLVRGAGRLARRLGVSSLIVGLTVVAFGTSAPELVVSAFAAGRGQGDVAVGNVIGSNIFNILAILGVTALIFPIAVRATLIRRELPFMVLATVLLPILAWDGVLSRGDGAVLFAGFAAYLGLMLWLARTSGGESVLAGVDEDVLGAADPARVSIGRNVAFILIGLVGLVLGARMLVDASVVFARAAGMSELVIGLTVVAAGTSLPELATSVVAALRRESDIAIGNVIGSNIFNLLAVLGLAGLIHPLTFAPALFRLELPVMIGASFALLPLAMTEGRIARWEGAALLAAYAGFMILLLFNFG
jgi:cation:H+ antiporter